MTDTNPTPSRDDDAMLAGHDEAPVSDALATAARMMRTRTAALLAAEGLFAGQDVLLLTLGGEKRLEVGEIAERLGVRAPTVSKTLTRLTEAGLGEPLLGLGGQAARRRPAHGQGPRQARPHRRDPFARRAGAAFGVRHQGRKALAQAAAQGHPHDLDERARRGGGRARARRCRAPLRLPIAVDRAALDGSPLRLAG